MFEILKTMLISIAVTVPIIIIFCLMVRHGIREYRDKMNKPIFRFIHFASGFFIILHGYCFIVRQFLFKIESYSVLDDIFYLCIIFFMANYNINKDPK